MYSPEFNQMLERMKSRSYMSKVINQHKKAPPQKFLEQKDAAHKIRYCLEDVTHKRASLHFPSPSEVFQHKSDAKSIEARNKGNEFFIISDFESAIDWYNRSICFAPSNSQNLGIGYANRSVVFFKAGFYKFCLQNIDLALANNYPESLKEKIDIRRKKCLAMMNQEDSFVKFDKEYNPMQLTYSPNERIPMMIEGLEIAQSEQYGRYIRTNRDLKLGDILIIEKPFAKHVNPELEYSRCANCLNQNYMNLFPCGRCTRTMFCSESCELEANKRFHKFECKIIDGIFLFTHMPVGTVVLTAIRTTLQSFTIFDDPTELQKLIEEIGEKDEAFDIDYSNLTEEQHFRALYSLATNELKRDQLSIFSYAQLCAIVWHLFSQYTDLPLLLPTKDLEDFFLNLLFRFFLAAFINVHDFKETCILLEDKQYFSGMFTLSSLLNHSCIPNTRRFFDKSTLLIVAKRSIKAGEQIFDCYGSHVFHGFATLEERQETLKFEFNFECQCIACLYDLPMLEDMTKPRIIHEKVMRGSSILQNFRKDDAKRIFEEFKKHVLEFEKQLPSFALYASEDIFMQAMWNLMFGRPLKKQLNPN